MTCDYTSTPRNRFRYRSYVNVGGIIYCTGDSGITHLRVLAEQALIYTTESRYVLAIHQPEHFRVQALIGDFINVVNRDGDTTDPCRPCHFSRYYLYFMIGE